MTDDNEIKPAAAQPAPKKGLLTDDEGNPSSGRWMAFGALLIAAILALAPALGFVDQPVDNNLVLYFLLAAFGGKVGQKFAENIKAAR